MNITLIKDYCVRYHIPELFGIVSAFFMAVISYVPIYKEDDIQQTAVVGYFLVVFFLRLLLFVWNRLLPHNGDETRTQAKMMFTSSVVILLTHSTVLIAVIYQVLENKDTPVMASLLVLSIVYGVYAVIKIVVSVFMMFRRKEKNLYTEILNGIGWISAMYTLTLFAHYLLVVRKTRDFVWVRYLLIAVTGLVTAIMGFIMLAKSLRVLKNYPKNI